MARIYVDGRAYDADPRQNLLHACLTLGFDLPYFCWHPAMGSVGACRQCAVKQFKDEEDTRGKIVMACMTPAAEGARISIADPDAAEFRRAVVEGLMLNHPHDCPVCDEGGECHLQDMTLMTGHDYRRYRFEKRTFRNQYLGPFLNHEMNRCIQCYRCVRFYREYAGGNDLNCFALHNTVYFGRDQDGVLESEFSGNLAEVCPTGVFTDKTLGRHYTRKWDQQFAPSVCVHCGLGCNTSPGERYKLLRRIVNRYNRDVNGWFLCDRGRFGYEFVNSDRRIRHAVWQGERVSKESALGRLAAILSKSSGVIGIGSPRASLEANFALREFTGAERFFAGIGAPDLRLLELILEILRAGPARTPSLHEIELCDAVLVLGEDVANVAPRMALSLRQSIRQQPMQLAARLRIPHWLDHAVRQVVQDARGPLFMATPAATRLDGIATAAWRAAPDDIARLGFAVARLLDPAAPEVRGLPDDMRRLADRIAGALRGARSPLVVAGPSLGSETVIRAATAVSRALHSAGLPAMLSYTVPESNSFGLAMMGAAPLERAFEAIQSGAADTVVILENDLYRRAPPEAVDRFLSTAPHVIVLDHLTNATTARAGLVLPAGTFAESDGTLVSNEGRAQRFFQVFVADGVQESWRWLADAMAAAGRVETASAWRSLDDVTAALAREMPAFARVPEAAPPSTFRMAGAKIPREPHRFSGRTAMLANITLHEPKPPDDPDSPLSFSMEGFYQPEAPLPVVPFFWAPGWNSVQAALKFQKEVNGPLRGGEPGVRLIEPPPQAAGAYEDSVPPPFERKNDEWLLVPLYHVFGSEELSAGAPAVSERVPKPWLALNPEDAGRLHVRSGEEMRIEMDGLAYRFPVTIDPALPSGVAGLAAGLPESPQGLRLPAWIRIRRTS
jgi:NADH-quinone oxidoreductase subunit G